MTETSHDVAQRNRVFDPATIAPPDLADVSPFQPFDPEAGVRVFQPEGEGQGWWVGAPSAFWDGDTYHLAFRTRRPQPERGGLFQIARGTDGERLPDRDVDPQGGPRDILDRARSAAADG